MGKDVETRSQGKVVACEICLKEIPRSVAQSQEGPEYVHFFCGDECYEKWCAAPEMQEIDLTINGLEVNFEQAQALAQATASQKEKQAMVVAWFDKRQGKESPEVPECQHKPGWLAYAESHGGNLKIDINHGEYIFIFSTSG